MQATHQKTTQTLSYLLLVLVVTQTLFTTLYIAEINVSRQFFWGLEGVLFTVLVALAGAALVQAKHYHIGWSAITFSAVFNLIQVSIGLTLFGPFREVAGELAALKPIAGAVVALSFMIYYAAKLLLGLAALIFGLAVKDKGAKVLGSITLLAGIVAMLANTLLIIFGRDAFLPSVVAGGSGVLATLLLALCLLKIAKEDK